MIAHFASPIGVLEIKATEEFVQSILFLDKAPVVILTDRNAIVHGCLQQLEAYFSGSRRIFDFPVQQSGTPFQQRVWQQLLSIPYGKTTSYLSLAKSLGDAKAIRAVGTANGRNNLSIVVPCHRVIGSNQSLTGYAGGLWRKQWLLEHEAKHANGVVQLF